MGAEKTHVEAEGGAGRRGVLDDISVLLLCFCKLRVFVIKPRTLVSVSLEIFPRANSFPVTVSLFSF